MDRQLRPLTEQVVYRFDRSSERLLRNGRAVTTTRFTEVLFDYRPCDPADKTGELLVVYLALAEGRQGGKGPAALAADGPGVVRLRLHCPHTTIGRAYDEYCL